MSGRLAYQPDETLHSFIFRVCLVNGVEEYADVTGQTACWRKTPYLNENIARYFTGYNDHDFLTLIRNSWRAIRNAEMFSDPTEYMSDVKNIYVHHHRKRGIAHRTQIKYCMNCIRESIKNNGYGYFKSSWHYKYSGYCITHNKSLTVSPRISSGKPYELIKTILRGEYPVGCYSTLNFINPKEEVTPPLYASTKEFNALPYDNGSFIYIADCLKNEIKKFILSYTAEFPKMGLINDCTQKKTIQHYPGSYLSRDHIISKILRCFFQENFTPFLSFWKENAVKTAVPCGVISITDIYEHIYIFRNSNACSMCNSLICPIKKRCIVSYDT